VIIKKHTAKAYARSKKIMDEAKSVPCLDCGETFPICCMDFHHVDPKTKYKRKTKNGGMGMIRLADLSEATLRAEIAKCVVICSNCHRIRTDVRYDKAFNA
jgi:5-methylcytosine-specific restriction endonuclease McrA